MNTDVFGFVVFIRALGTLAWIFEAHDNVKELVTKVAGYVLS